MSASGHIDPRPPPLQPPKLKRLPTLQRVPQAGRSNSASSASHEYRHTSQLCARFITHLFSCSESPPPGSLPLLVPAFGMLPKFIECTLYYAKFDSSVAFCALVLLQRLKACIPTARGCSGHRLFISAYMVASKVLCDSTHSNRLWCKIAQHMFPLQEINRLERGLCDGLNWKLAVHPLLLNEFQDMVHRDFQNPTGPFLTYSLCRTSSFRAAAIDVTTSLVDQQSVQVYLPV